jgi:TP901 family phage tail tape measure protein
MTSGGTAGSVTAVGRLIFDASAVRAGVAGAHASLDTMYNVIRNNWWGIRAIGDAFQSTGAIAATAFGAAAAAAIQFQSGMAAVARTTSDAQHSADLSSESVQQLGKELQHIAEIRPTDLNTLTDIAEQAGALGIKRDDVAAFTATIVDLITTTNLTQESAVQLAKVANIFGLSGEQFAKLGSAVYQVGVNTAATEEDIVNLTVRLAPAASQFGLTTAQTTGLAAATLSLGVQSEAAGTALSRFFQQMERAASGVDPTSLLAFSDLIGVTSQKFQQMVQQDPSAALTQVVDALAKVSAEGGNTTAIFDSLGISEQREIRTLNALAEGAQQPVDSYLNLHGALKQATDAYNDGKKAADAAEQQNKTLGAQLQELRNIVNNIAIAFGQRLQGPMQGAVHLIRNLAVGVENLPGPLKQAIVYAGGTVGALAGIGGILILVLPRLTLAVNAFRAVTASMGIATAAAQANAVANSNNTKGQLALAFATGRNYRALQSQQAVQAAVARQTQITLELRAANVRTIEQEELLTRLNTQALAQFNTGQMQALELTEARIAETRAQIAVTDQNILALEGETAALDRMNASQARGTVAAGLLGRAFGSFSGVLTLALVAFTAITFVVGRFGHDIEDAQKNTEEFKTSVSELKGQLDATTNSFTAAGQAAISQKLATDKLGDSSDSIVDALRKAGANAVLFTRAVTEGTDSAPFAASTKELQGLSQEILNSSGVYQQYKVFADAAGVSQKDFNAAVQGSGDGLERIERTMAANGQNTGAFEIAINNLRSALQPTTQLYDELVKRAAAATQAQKENVDSMRDLIPQAARAAKVDVDDLSLAFANWTVKGGHFDRQLLDNGITARQVGTIMRILTGNTSDYSAATSKAARGTSQLSGNMQSVEGVLERTHGRVNQVVRDYIALELAQQGLIGIAHRLGINTQQLVTAVTNVNGPTAQHVRLLIQEAIVAGADGTQLNRLNTILADLTSQYGNARHSARQTTLAQDDLGRSLQDVGSAASGAADTGRDYQQVLDDASTAAASLVSDTLSVEQATRDLASAEQDLADAQAAHARLPHDLAEAELDLASNRFKVADAARAVRDAEKDLQNWRSDARDQISQDAADQSSAQMDYRESVTKVHDAEAALKDLREHGEEEHVARLTDLTNKLRDAQNALTHANVTAQDAQFNLNQIIAEGGSARDVANAHRELRDAQLGVADARTAIGSAQDAVGEERHFNLTVAIKDAELELRKANLASAESLDKLHESTQKLNQDRRDLRSGRDYRLAAENLTEAQLNLMHAQDQLYESQQKLKDIRQLITNDTNLADAEARVESAAVSLADAQTTLADDTAKANGEVVTANEHLQTFRDKLGGIASDIGGKVGTELDNLHDKLKIGDIRAHVEVSMSGDDAVIRRAHKVAEAVKPLGDTKQAAEYVVLDGIMIGRRGINITSAVAQGGIIAGGTTFQYGNHQQGIAGEGATPEAIMPLHDLWHNLAPLANIAAADAETNRLLTQVIRELGGSPGRAGATVSHHNEHHYDINVQAHTDADVSQIGRDIAWNIRAVK